MSQSKSIIITSLLCLSFFTSQLHANETNELKTEKQKTKLSLNSVVNSLSGTVNGVKNGVGQTLGGTVNGVGKTLGGTINGVGKTLGGALSEIDYLLADVGEVALDVVETAAFIGAAFVYALYDYDGYYFNQGYNRGYNYGRPRNYNDGTYR